MTLDEFNSSRELLPGGYINPVYPTAPNTSILEVYCSLSHLLLDSSMMATVDMNFIQIYQPRPSNPSSRRKKRSVSTSNSDGWLSRAVSPLNQAESPHNELLHML